MKNLMRSKIQTLMLLFAMLAFTACEKEEIFGDQGTIQSGVKTFDLDTFQENMVDALGTEWAGYSYVINYNGQGERFGAFGNRRAGNDGNAPHNISAPMYAASINKTITAAATLRVLATIGNEDVGSMLNANVYQYLPNNWNFGPNTTNITFKNLLQHRSGLAGNAPIDFASLRTLFATGTSGNKDYQYSNANYALLRIIIGTIEGTYSNSDLNSDAKMSGITLAAFDRYMRTNIFDPFNIDVETTPFGNNPALYYAFGEYNNGWNIGDLSSRLGNGGYYIAPVNIAKLFAFINHTDDILTPAMRELMYDNFLGWSDGGEPQNEPDGEHGTYYYKGGSFCNSSANGGCNGQGVRNILASFPDSNVEVIIMANSRGGNMDSSSSLRSMLRDSHDAAYIY